MPSSVIHGMLYRPLGRTLDVVFRDRRAGTYRYFEVGEEEWMAFKRASSKGTYLNAVFKARHPRFERVGAVRGEVVGALAADAGGFRDLPDANVWGFYEGEVGVYE